jgi:uncharacterized protein YoaH (UPF0181 family)
MHQYESVEEIFQELRENGHKAMTMDDFNGCIVGVGSRCGQMDLVVYDEQKIIDQLVSEGMTHGEAVEYFEFNIAGAWVGDGTPIIMRKLA